MKKIYLANNILLFILVSFGLLIISSCNVDKSNADSNRQEELIEAANRLDSSFLRAFNAGDVDAIMQLYWNSPELVTYPPARQMQLKGWNAVRDFNAADFARNKGGKLEYISNRNEVIGDAVVGSGLFRWSMEIPGSAPAVFEGRHTVIKTMKDGKMVIVLDHTSSPQMPPAEAAERTQ